jgi:predicted acylesterase/phospholipase RssA
MIDVQSIVVASTATDWFDREGSAGGFLRQLIRQFRHDYAGRARFFRSQSARCVGTPYTGQHRTGGIYTTAPLERTLKELVDFDHLNNNSTRLTVGAVSVRTGEMRYFDSRDMILGPEHVMASGALPPGFPAIRVDREPYWDGGLYSNTPVEVVFDDKPRRSSLIFSVICGSRTASSPRRSGRCSADKRTSNMASRGRSHVARQEQIHRLRHVNSRARQAAARGGAQRPRRS